MSLLTVAHQRGSGEFTGFTVKRDGDSDGGGSSGTSQSLNFNQMQSNSSMVYNGDRELTQMVSALTHVSSSGSNQMSNNEWIQRSGFLNSSSSSSYSSGSGSGSGFVMSSGSWSGNKRGRDEESSGSNNHFLQQSVPKLFRTVMVPSQGQGQGESSSSAAVPSRTPQQPVQGSSDLIRDYLEYSQILQSSGDFQLQQMQQQQQLQQQEHASNLVQQWYYNSQLAALQSHSMLSTSSSLSIPSNLSPPIATILPSTQFSTSSTSFPLFSSQQMGFFGVPENRPPPPPGGGRGGETEFPPSTWSDTSGHPPPPYG
ncbi:hypothetical protein TSUD_288130 [Trifolium subterraneum]|uniref:Uncharacterized protein n=1 Tax=Trifolium subterraneum TaxID=3900 RepID=A0A2Z6NGM5_TRISU|nr:hypothetical protein TSUD_288130 [Trifolium subterraneum]